MPWHSDNIVLSYNYIYLYFTRRNEEGFVGSFGVQESLVFNSDVACVAGARREQE